MKQVWVIGADALPVRFTRAGGFLLEEEYLFLYLEVVPDMEKTGDDDLVKAAVSITHKLSGRLNSTKLVRAFKNEEHRKSADNRFQGNDDLLLIRGILGELITVEEIFDSLAGEGWQTMLCERFLLNSLLITPVDDLAPEYSEDELADLIRLGRGMNKTYLPPPLEALAGHVIPVRTFANVLFMAANEGVAGHIKPAPEQEFLLNQFSGRHHSEYTLLFVLAMYQHYRLVDLIRSLAELTEGLEESGQILDSERIEKLRKSRKRLVVHELKYINTHPAFLLIISNTIPACAKG
ncbi:MAG: hypothetical protein D3924_19055 [Candidatus Electrothrix sp. AR4]|nr:hypothetical protein [Candidatus Electrothrix sp. AR4]